MMQIPRPHHLFPAKQSAYVRPTLGDKTKVQLSRDKFDAVLFDMDGIVTKTANVHALAWKQTFDEFLRKRAGDGAIPFDITRDYHAYVDGKPRFDGVADFLQSRHVKLPWGNSSDRPGYDTICALGNLKNQLFLEQLKKHHAEVYDTTLRLIDALKRAGFKVAIITASENAVAILQTANVLQIFEAKVDGLDAKRLHLKGKPAPDVFLEAAKQLGVAAQRAVVVEDAAAGVEAGRNGSFGLVIGVDRNQNADLLKKHGADVVVKDLSDVGVQGQPYEIPSMASADLSVCDPSWFVAFEEYVPAEEGRREALLALGNGYFATRAAAPESVHDDVHAPGTYLAGGYNRLQTQIGDMELSHEDLVNLPNWLALTFRIGDGEWFDLSNVEILDYKQELNLREGVLYRNCKFRDAHGHESSLAERRFVHMRQFHLACLERTITPHNWSGPITIRSALDGRGGNIGIKLYSPVGRKHLKPVESAIENDVLYLRMQTTQSRCDVAQCASLRLLIGGAVPGEKPKFTNQIEDNYVSHEISVDASADRPITIRKVASLFTSRDHGISEPGLAAREAVARCSDFETLFADHIEAWKHLWYRFEFSLETREDSSKIDTLRLLRLNSFHVLQTASFNSIDLDVGVPARGWGGEGYQGHVFWDDLFVFPFVTLRTPEITEALLKYRYRRLDEARYMAREMGLPGARYPWQSGSSGREETPLYVWMADRQRWAPDHTRLQVHVNAAIAFNIWRYYQSTGNLEFMSRYGADMLLEIARFFAHLAKYNPDRSRFEIHGVVGPDEYHQSYPDGTKPGINNNAYTNIMAVWTICRALELIDLLPPDQCNEVCERLNLTPDELRLFDVISRRMFLPLQQDGIINQFEGYEQLQEFPRRLDGGIDGDLLKRILQEQGGQLNQYKLSKQADVLMLFYLFSAQELEELFGRLGYQFQSEMISTNINSYMPNTVNNSTLSRIVHAWVLSRANRSNAWKILSSMSSRLPLALPALPPLPMPLPPLPHHSLACMCPRCLIRKRIQSRSWPHSWQIFEEALGSDFFDIQGGTTSEGVHIGAMAGSIDIVQRCYTGMVTRGDILWLNPRLPDELTRLTFNLHFRQQAIRLEITHETTKIVSGRSAAKPVRIGVKDKVYDLYSGESRIFDNASGSERS